jgi:hypothetical protein
MSFKDIPDNQLLSELEVLDKIDDALVQQKPFSLVRIGDGENIILAQEKFLSDHELLNTFWVKRAQKKKDDKGIMLPCYELRDQVIEAIRKADLVGVCNQTQKLGDAPLKFCRDLTNKVFDFYPLNPKCLCNVWVNRQLVAYRLFWELLHQYRILIISKWADAYAAFIIKEYASIKPNIAGCLSFSNFAQIKDIMDLTGKRRFDLALISAGVNAVILASKIAERYGKVALDFGKTMRFMLREHRELVNPWKPEKIN